MTPYLRGQESVLDTAVLCSAPLIDRSIISDTDETIRIIRMEIGRVAWDLELPEYSWFARVSERYDEEWIDLFECDEIETISDEPRGLEGFIWSNILNFSYDLSC
jgi:hypothetical protein